MTLWKKTGASSWNNYTGCHTQFLGSSRTIRAIIRCVRDNTRPWALKWFDKRYSSVIEYGDPVLIKTCQYSMVIICKSRCPDTGKLDKNAHILCAAFVIEVESNSGRQSMSNGMRAFQFKSPTYPNKIRPPAPIMAITNDILFQSMRIFMNRINVWSLWSYCVLPYCIIPSFFHVYVTLNMDH